MSAEKENPVIFYRCWTIVARVAAGAEFLKIVARTS